MMDNLIDFINNTPTVFHCAENVSRMLLENGFSERQPGQGKLEAGGKYFTVFGGSAVIAYAVPGSGKPTSLRVAAAHGDSPCFKLKPTPEQTQSQGTGGLTMLSTERYGGMIYSGWLDRPLGVAGRVIVRDGCAEGSVDIKSINVRLDGTALIPNVAVHQNRNINSGFTYDPSKDLKALWTGNVGSKPLYDRIAAALSDKTEGVKIKKKIKKEDILDFDLFLYNPEPGIIWGEKGEFISAPRLDDLQCVYAVAKAFLSAVSEKDGRPGQLCMLCIFDNEETGSASCAGADSPLLAETVREIADAFSVNLLSLAQNGRLLSADNAHALHPNHPELSDQTDRPVLNGGVVIKYNASQKYITTAVGAAEAKLLCERAGVRYQTFTNRSDLPGGSTLGSLSSTQLPLLGTDVGIAQLAMHSCFETAGAEDTENMKRFIQAFYRY